MADGIAELVSPAALHDRARLIDHAACFQTDAIKLSRLVELPQADKLRSLTDLNNILGYVHGPKVHDVSESQDYACIGERRTNNGSLVLCGSCAAAGRQAALSALDAS